MQANPASQSREGRKQKAREGKWNGGFAPYGYKLVSGKLEIEEQEAEAVRIIYDKYVNKVFLPLYQKIMSRKKDSKAEAVQEKKERGRQHV